MHYSHDWSPCWLFPGERRRYPCVVLTLGHRRRRWPCVKTAQGPRLSSGWNFVSRHLLVRGRRLIPNPDYCDPSGHNACTACIEPAAQETTRGQQWRIDVKIPTPAGHTAGITTQRHGAGLHVLTNMSDREYTTEGSSTCTVSPDYRRSVCHL